MTSVQEKRTFDFIVTLIDREDQDAVIDVINQTVPVVSCSGASIGSASLYDADSRIRARISVDYDTNERLDLEINSRPMYLSFLAESGSIELGYTERKGARRLV